MFQHYNLLLVNVMNYYSQFYTLIFFNLTLFLSLSPAPGSFLLSLPVLLPTATIVSTAAEFSPVTTASTPVASAHSR